MRRFIRIGRLLGIPIGVNPSWFLLLVLVVSLLATQAFPEALHDTPPWLLWLLALGGGLLFFASMVLHELAHSVMARFFGVPVRSITLFVLGAVAQTARETRRPGHEFLIAIAGPVVSILISGVFMVLWLLTGRGTTPVSLLCEWLWLANFAVGLFNMVPAFPMDGGRVLRSVLWGFSGNYRRATRWAALVGRGFALTLVGVGVLVAVQAPWFDRLHPVSGVQFVLVGLFINVAARQSDLQSGILDLLSGYRVADAMLRDVPVLLSSATVEEALAGPMAGYGPAHEWLFVSDGEHFVGLAARAALLTIPEERRPHTTVGEALIPRERLQATSPGEPLHEVLQRMDSEETPVMVVVQDGQVTGLIHRGLLLGLMPRRRVQRRA